MERKMERKKVVVNVSDVKGVEEVKVPNHVRDVRVYVNGEGHVEVSWIERVVESRSSMLSDHMEVVNDDDLHDEARELERM